MTNLYIYMIIIMPCPWHGQGHAHAHGHARRARPCHGMGTDYHAGPGIRPALVDTEDLSSKDKAANAVSVSCIQ